MTISRIGLTAILLALVAAGSSSNTAAQVSGPGDITIELGGGGSIGGHSSSAAGLETAAELSYHALFGYRLSESLSVFGGYARTAYGCENAYCRTINPVLTAQHGVVGAELNRGGGWLRVGAAYGASKGVPAELTELPPSDPSQGLGALISVGTTWGRGAFRARPFLSYLYYLTDDAVAGGGHGIALTAGFGFQFRLVGG